MISKSLITDQGENLPIAYFQQYRLVAFSHFTVDMSNDN